MSKKIEDLADRLIGSCESLDLDDLTMDEAFELDDLARCCEGCGWWVEAFEIDDNGNCTDCVEEEA